MARPTEPSTPTARDPWPWHVGALLGYLLLGVLATWPLLLKLTVAVPGFDSPVERGGMADQDHGLWAQWWFGQSLAHHTDPLHAGLLYWPYYTGGLSLLLNDTQWLREALALPAQLLLGLAASYNFGIFVSFTLGGYGAFLLARELGLSRPSAALAGLIFVAGPYHLMQLFWETSLIVSEALPFALLWSLRALRGGGRWPILLAALCIVWVNLSNWYYGLYTLLALVMLTAGIAWRRRKGGWTAVRPVLGRCLLVGSTYGLIYSPLLGSTLAEVLGAQNRSGLFLNIATIRGASMPWYRLFVNARDPLTQPAVWHDTGFLGYTAIALILLGCLCYWRRAWPLLALFFVFLNLAAGPDLSGLGGPITFPDGTPVPSPYFFLMRLPGMTLLRAPSHAGMVLLLLGGLLAGLGLDALAMLVSRARPASRGVAPTLLATAAGLFALGEYLVLPLPLYKIQWQPAFTQIGQDTAPGGILELPITLHASNDHHRLFNQIAHDKGIAGGYLPRPVPDPYRQPDSPFALFTQPYTRTDVLAEDGDEAARALLTLYDFHYFAVYHERKNYRVGNSPWDWPPPGPAIGPPNPEVSVYSVPAAPLDHEYLYLGNSWGLAERVPGGVRRSLGPDPGYILLWTPGGSGRLALDFEAEPGEALRRVELAIETRPLLTTTIRPAPTPQTVTGPRLSLASGWYRFRLTDVSLGGVTPSPSLYLRRAAWQAEGK